MNKYFFPLILSMNFVFCLFMKVSVKRLTKTAILPTRANDHAAGWDLYSDETVFIPAHERKIIKTGIALAFPPGYVALVQDRSGMAAKHGITYMAGVGDADYRGEYHLVLRNTSDQDYEIKQGDRIAQMLFLPLPEVELCELEDLDETSRGDSRFGSTGY